jgi:predicted transposase YbfD/YdcC
MHPTTLPFDLLLPDEPLALDLSTLYTRLQRLPDQRARRGVRYPLPMLLLIALLAKLSGQHQVRAIAQWAALRAAELAHLFQFPRASMPHHTTWSRVLGHAVDVAALHALLQAVLCPTAHEVPARASIALAIDGKTLRGTIPLGHTQGVHLGAAYLPEQGVTLLQLQVAAKENEITVAPSMVAQIDLTGVVVTGDAMYTQRPLSTHIVEAGGDYLWIVKDNQPELRDDIEQLFVPEPNEFGTAALPTDFTTIRMLEKGHGRIEERRLTTSSMLQDYSTWPYLTQVFKVESVVTTRGGTRTTVRYGVTSLPVTVADASRLLALARGHWGIENGLHYRRDATLGEDRALVRTGHAPHMLATLNNTVLGLFARYNRHNVPQAQRTFSYHLERALARHRQT